MFVQNNLYINKKRGFWSSFKTILIIKNYKYGN